ncbi:MAG: hypothetical protein EBU27_02925 [Opitutae bacterium]|nr:hypothetical protein [Opitutae bacterium]
MESRFWLYAYVSLGGAVLFASGYYLGLSGENDTKIEAQKFVSYQNIKESPKDLQRPGVKVVSQPSASSMGFDSTVDESNKPVEERQRGGIREILDQFVNETNPVYKYATLAEAMKQLNPDNLEETLEVFESIPFGFENMQEYRMLLYAWSQFDPYGAIDYCKSRASGMGAGFAVSGVLEGWAARNPQEALTWVEKPENQGMAKLYNFGLIKGWASTDLEGASEYVMNMEGGDEVEKLAGTLAEFYNKRGFGEASRWAEEIENPKLKEAAFTKLSRSLARDQPEQMASWLGEHSDKKYATKAFENLGLRWSETDPESAIDFFSELPEGKNQELGVKNIIGNWAKKDSLAAGTWLNEQPAGPRLDSALASYASTVSRDDAGSAMEWAVSISEEKLQQKTIRSVGQEWYRQDKESVEAWLPQSGLSEDLQKSIRNPPKKNWWQSLRDL